MKKTLIFLFLFFGVCFFVRLPAGASGGMTRPAMILENRGDAQKICDQVFSVYRNYSHNAFADLISDDMLPSKLEFINAVESDLAEKHILSLDGSLITVLTPKGRMVVMVRWEKKYQAKDAGEPTLDAGMARLMFVKENGTWKLFRVSGNNPF